MGELSHTFAMAGANADAATVHIKFADFADWSHFNAEVHREILDLKLQRSPDGRSIYPVTIFGIRVIVEGPTR